MRLVFPVLLILLGLVLVGFLFTNPGERVTVTLVSTSYPDVPLFLVVFVSLVVGVAFTAAVALIEGAGIRLVNRRLRKEIQRLETEATFLRTEPRAPSHSEPEDPAEGPAGPVERYDRVKDVREQRPSSAPVYDVDPTEPER